MPKSPRAITRDQEFMAAMLCELKELNQRVKTIESKLPGNGVPSETVCGECGRDFNGNARALRAHMKAHKKDEKE